MLSVGPPVDRQRERRERRRPILSDPGQRRQNLSVGLSQQRRRLQLDVRNIGLQDLPACQVRPSLSARNSASAGGESSRFHRSAQNRACASVIRPGALARSDRISGARPSKATAQASTAWPVGVFSANARP